MMLATALSMTIDGVLIFGYAILACVLCFRIAFFNVAIEGQLAVASLAYSLAATAGYGAGMATAFAVAAAIALAVALIFVRLVFRVDDIVAGLALNLLCLGASMLVAQHIVDQQDIWFELPESQTAASLRVSFAAILGASVVGYYLVGMKARYSTWLIAVRENEDVSRLADVPVMGVISISLLASAVMAGLCGSYRAISLNSFSPDHVRVGTGFIALGLVVAADGNLPVAVLGSIAFVLCRLAQISSGSTVTWLPAPFYEVLPYVVVMGYFVAVGLVRQRYMRRASCTPVRMAKAAT